MQPIPKKLEIEETSELSLNEDKLVCLPSQNMSQQSKNVITMKELSVDENNHSILNFEEKITESNKNNGQKSTDLQNPLSESTKKRKTMKPVSLNNLPMNFTNSTKEFELTSESKNNIETRDNHSDKEGKKKVVLGKLMSIFNEGVENTNENSPSFTEIDEGDQINPQTEKMKIIYTDIINRLVALEKENEVKVAEINNDSDEEHEKELEKLKLALPDEFYLELREMNELEMAKNYNDSYPFLKLRKKILYKTKVFSMLCNDIIKSWIFELFTLLVILANSAILSLTVSKVIDSKISDESEIYFLTLYTMEMFFKITAMGFIIPKKSYIRDPWNILDFVIVITSYLPYIMGSGANITVLRAFRVLRPLKTISKLKQLRILLTVIFDSINNLKDLAVLMGFFYMIFAIAGLQLLSGMLKKVCQQEKTGFLFVRHDGRNPLCNDDCPDEYFCGKAILNPSDNIMNFDTIFWSLLQVYQVVTMEGWTLIESSIQRTFSFWMFIYFLIVVFIGSFFLLNMMLAVIAFWYHQRSIGNDLNDSKSKKNIFNLRKMKKFGFFKGNREISKINDSPKNNKKMSWIEKIKIIGNRLSFHQRMEKFWNKSKNSKIGNFTDERASILNSPQNQIVNIQPESATKLIEFKNKDSPKITHSPKKSKRFSISQDKTNFIKPLNINIINIKRKSKQLRFNEIKNNNSPFRNTNNNSNNLNNLKELEIDDKFINEITEIEKEKTDKNNTKKDYLGLSILNLIDKKFLKKNEKTIEIQNKLETTSVNPTPIRQNKKMQSYIGIGLEKNQSFRKNLRGNTNIIKLPSKNFIFEKDNKTPNFHINTPKSANLSMNPRLNSRQKLGTKIFNFIDDEDFTYKDVKTKPIILLKQNSGGRHSKTLTPISGVKDNSSSNRRRRFSRKKSVLYDGKKVNLPGFEDLINQNEDDPEKEKLRKESKNKKLAIRIISEKGFNYENSSKDDILKSYKEKERLKIISQDRNKVLKFHYKLYYKIDKNLINYDLNSSEINFSISKDIQNDYSSEAASSFKRDSQSQSIYCSKRSILSSSKKKKNYNNPKYFNYNLQNEYNNKFKIKFPLFSSKHFGYQESCELEILKKNTILNQKTISNCSHNLIPIPAKNSHTYSRSVSPTKQKNDKGIDFEWTLEKAKEKILGIESENKKTKNNEIKSTKLIDDVEKGNRNDKTKNIIVKDYQLKYELKIKKEIKKDKPIHFLTENNSENLSNNNSKHIFSKVFSSHKLNTTMNDDDKTKIKDIESRKKVVEIWSGGEVLNLILPADHIFTPRIQKRMATIIKALNYKTRDFLIWEPNLFEFIINSFRRLIYKFITLKNYDNAIMLCVVMNTIILSLDGLVDDSDSTMTNMSNAFTYIFAADMGLKIIALGIKDYLRDTFNIFDGCIVILSIVEISILSSGGGSAFSAFRSVRIFRAFRVLRVSKIVRSLGYMKKILNAISKSLEGFSYIALLLGIFIYIYSLLGLQIFQTSYSKTPYRSNYLTLTNSFIATFQLLTIENWNLVMYDMYNSSVNIILSTIFLLSWIFIGNYILLNLFLAVLLEGFEGEEEIEEKEKIKGKNKKIKNKSKKSENIKNSKGKLSIINQTKNSISPQKDSAPNSPEKSLKSMKSMIDSNYNKKDISSIECNYSVFIFSKKNPIRLLSFYIINHKKFESVILFLIIISSFKLVVDSYFDEEEPNFKVYSYILDMIFTVLFTLECIFKIISFGFILEKKSYLRDLWSILDFIVVSFSILDAALTNYNFSFVKIFRLLRMLRPLRFISHNKSMKILVNALLKSFYGIANVLVVIFLIWLMFAILGINFMKGRMGYCADSSLIQSALISTNKTQCQKNPNYNWLVYGTNFDNIFNAMITLFIFSTFEGWPDIMFRFSDSNTEEYGPAFEESLMFSYYIIGFIIVSSIFLMNLFVAIISVEFKKAEKEEKKSSLSFDQTRWIEIQKLIVLEKIDYVSFQIPDNKYRRILYNIVKSSAFEPFIIFCIIANIVTLGMTYDGSGIQYDKILEDINLFFTSLFMLEFVMKIISFGIFGYFHNNWNKFDCCVVFVSIIELILNSLGSNQLKFLKIGPQIGRVFRVMRVTRLLKLVKSFKNLRNLIQIALYTLPALLNVASLTFLFFFVYAVLGNQLFKSARGQILDDFQNFDNFGNALHILFRCSTGEDWYSIMFDCNTFMKTELYSLYFLTFLLGGQYIMLNLFVLVILDEFNSNYIDPDNPLQLQSYQMDVETFKNDWALFTAKDFGVKINEKQLLEFFFKLKEPLGFDLKNNIEKIKKDIEENFEQNNFEMLKKKSKVEKEAEKALKIEQEIEELKNQTKIKANKAIMNMDMMADLGGYVFFNEILFQTLKRNYNEYIYPKNIEEDVEDEIYEEELKNLEKIRANRKKIRIKNKKKTISLFSSGLTKRETKKVNPLMDVYFRKMFFYSWRNFSYYNLNTNFEKIIPIKEKIRNTISDFSIPLSIDEYNVIIDEIEQDNDISSVVSSLSVTDESLDIDNIIDYKENNINKDLIRVNEEDENENDNDNDDTNKNEIENISNNSHNENYLNNNNTNINYEFNDDNNEINIDEEDKGLKDRKIKNILGESDSSVEEFAKNEY